MGGMSERKFQGIEIRRRGLIARTAEVFNRLRGRQDRPAPTEPTGGPTVATSVKDFNEKFRAAIKPDRKKTEEDRPTNNPRVVIVKVIDPSSNAVTGHSLELIASNKSNTKVFVTHIIPLDENPDDTEEVAAQRRLLTGIFVAEALQDVVVSYAWLMQPDVPYDPENASKSLIPLTDRARLKLELAEVQPYAVQGVPATQPPTSA